MRAHIEVIFQMYPKCDWWLQWGKNDPELSIYPRCSHWFPGHLTPSGMGCWVSCWCQSRALKRAVQKRMRSHSKESGVSVG
jgi:hypothetical protein